MATYGLSLWGSDRGGGDGKIDRAGLGPIFSLRPLSAVGVRCDAGELGCDADLSRGGDEFPDLAGEFLMGCGD